MLSLGKIAAGPQAAAYYTDQVARGRDDYYSGEGEAPGSWVGSGAAARGLSGDVQAERFEHLLAGAGLRRPPRDGAVAGFDLTFRAPKSVSVLWGIADRDVVEQLRAGHDAAVVEALGYVEREACWARRGRGGHIQVRGRGFVAAAFVHRASRAGDPLLHTHVVVGNLTQGPDDRWTALDARHLYRHAKTAGYLYQAVLRRELTERLGLEWQPVERGVADIEGVPRDGVEHFSQRRAEILQHMTAHDGRSAHSAQVAALETRRAKQNVPVDRLREVWRARAIEHGLDPTTVERLLDRQWAVPLATPVTSEVLTREQSSFGRPELLQALAEAQPGGAGVADLEQLADAMLSDREVVRLQDGVAPAGVTEQRFSTCDQLNTEAQLLESAHRRTRCGAGVVSDDKIAGALAGRGLTREQAELVTQLCSQGDGIAVVRAPAGTGKTFALDAARQAWQDTAHEVVGCAVSARAAAELRDSTGIHTLTIAAVKHHLDDHRELPARGVLIVDEAGMAGTRDLARLAQAAEESDAKLVLVGDDRQLPEIEAGGAFRTLARETGAIELREVRRQNEAWDRQALDDLRNGRVERWARAYRDHGRITVGRTAAETRAALVNDWFRATGERVMIAARNDDVRDLNERARDLRRAYGALGPDELRTPDRGFAAGDAVVGRRNDRRVGILNGDRGHVVAIDGEQRTLTVELRSGERAEIPSTYLDAGHLDHGYAVTAHRAQGMTVDRAYVLGSDELYREWGYTALSRHRDEARFYVAGGDLDLRRDAAPSPDPVIERIGELVRHSHAKTMALDQLPEHDRRSYRDVGELPREDLEREHASLIGEIGKVPWRREERAAHSVDEAAQSLDEARERTEYWRTRHDELPFWKRREREAAREYRDANARDTDRAAERYAAAIADQDEQRDAQETWIERYGATSGRLLAIDQELRARDGIATEVQRRVERVTQRPDPLERENVWRMLERPHLDHDVGLDLDLDLGP